MKAMDGQAYFRILWRKLICVVGALLVMGVPMSASLCAASDCSGQSSKTDARCSGMAMLLSVTSINAQSLLGCCHIMQGPPPVFRQSTNTDRAKAEFSSAPLGTALPSVVATRGMLARPVDSSPLHDAQSLFCTFLI